MGLRRAINEKILDVRLRDKFLADGKVSKEEIDRYLASLTDDEANSEFISQQVMDKERKRK